MNDTSIESSLDRKIPRAIAGWARRINTVAYAVVLLFLIAFGGLAIIEIVSRVNIMSSLKGEISANQSVLALESSRSEVASTASSTPSVGDKFRGPRPISPISREDRTRYLEEAQGLLAQVVLLSSMGTTIDCFTLAELVRSRNRQCDESITVRYTALRLGAWSDEGLFLALAICSGAIGALVAGLRTKQFMLFALFRDLALGFASGFIVYLGMKGGKHVFLMSTTDAPVLLNPYAYAFAGILVGLFTERAYNLLSSLVGELERRLLGSVASK